MKKLLSLIALAGIFAACQPEELKTAFDAAKAKATINVRVVDVRTKEAPASYKVLADGKEVSGSVITLEGSPALAQKTVSITVRYQSDYMSAEETTEAQTVNVAALRAGGEATYDVTFVVGYPESKYTITCERTKEGVYETEKEYFTPSDSHAETHTHDGGLWVRNNTEFILTGVVTWYSYNGALATYTMNESLKEDVKEDVEELETVVKDYAKLFTYGYKDGKLVGEKHELNLQVSAYCYYTAYQINTKVTGREYTVSAEKDGKKVVVGTITVKSNTSSSAEYEEKGDPNAHGHYVYGHGHAHGHGTDNAGGGIVTPE